MSELVGLREELRTKCIRFGVSIGGAAMMGLVYAENFAPRPLAAIAGVMSLGQAAHDVLKAHTLGQEIAAVKAAQLTHTE